MLEIPYGEELMPVFGNCANLCFFLRWLFKMPDAELVFLCFTCEKEAIILLTIVIK
jgi:hypothetical protein